MGTEDKGEYDNLIAKGHKHIIFTNRNVIPDMKAVPETLKLFQIEVQSTPTEDGRYNLQTSVLPCGCPQYRNHQPFSLCLLKNERNIKSITVSKQGIEYNEDNDKFGLKKLTVEELENQLRERLLPLIHS